MDKNSFVALVRIVNIDELDAIENGNENDIGSIIVDTAKNTFDNYNEDQNYAFCYPLTIEAENIRDAKKQIMSYDYSMLVDDLGNPLRYMLREKQKFEPNNYQILCTVVSEEDYEKMKVFKRIIEGEGFYETEDDEAYEIPEVIVTPDVLIEAYNKGQTMSVDPRDIDLLPKSRTGYGDGNGDDYYPF